MSIDYHSRAYLDFKALEEKKYPAFGKLFWDDEGVISGGPHLSTWKWQADQYIKDRTQFLRRQFPGPSETSIEKPPQKVVKKKRRKEKKQPAKKGNSAAAKKTFVDTDNSKQHRNYNQSSYREEKKRQLTMPGPTKRSTAWRKKKGGRRKRRVPPQLRSIRIPFKTVMDVDSKKSSAETGFFYNHLTLKELAPTVLSVYEEFKICGMKVRYIPQDVTSGAGLYAAVLLDQNGFGDPSKGPATWFPRVADLPGARMCNVSRGCAFSWRPTEPDAKNYRKCHESGANGMDYIAASFYIFAQAQDKNLTGKLLITGSVRVRGEFYSASVCDRLTRLNLDDAADTGSDSSASSASIID